MKRPNITPGEWRNEDGCIYGKEDDDDFLVCDVAPQNAGLCEADEINARAIAALPKLLETLESVDEYFAALEVMQPDRNHGTEGARIRGAVRSAMIAAGYEEPDGDYRARYAEKWEKIKPELLELLTSLRKCEGR